jgi:hypothetical protein
MPHAAIHRCTATIQGGYRAGATMTRAAVMGYARAITNDGIPLATASAAVRARCDNVSDIRTVVSVGNDARGMVADEAILRSDLAVYSRLDASDSGSRSLRVAVTHGPIVAASMVLSRAGGARPPSTSSLSPLFSTVDYVASPCP